MGRQPLAVHVRRHDIRETKTIAVWVLQDHFSCAPRSVSWRPSRHDTPGAELDKALVDVGHHKVHSTTDLAVLGVLGQENGLAGARQLHEEGQAWLKPVLPVYGET